MKTPSLLLSLGYLAWSCAQAGASPACSTSTFSELLGTSIAPGADVIDVKATPLQQYKSQGLAPYFSDAIIDACQVEATYINPNTNSTQTHVKVWLPLGKETWNERFVGTGGGGWQCTLGNGPMHNLIQAGFATANTDGGLRGMPFETDYTLLSPGNPDTYLLERLGHRAIHDMTLLAKRAVQLYFEQPAKTNYYAGCSTGGRQGIMEAARYPEDYDGYLIGAPAVRWNRMVINSMKDTVAMYRLRSFPSPCELGSIIEAAVEACDSLDGRTDGVIMRPDLCTFSAVSAVNRPYADHCDANGEIRHVTENAAKFMQKAVDGVTASSGRHLGPGFPWGTNITFGVTSTARTRIDPKSGQRIAEPFPLAKQWVEHYLKRGLEELDMSTITYDDMEKLADQSERAFADVIDPPADLSAARARGAKILMYHGLEDSIIPVGNSLLFYDEVRRATIGQTLTDSKSLQALQSFFRLFIVPGMAHCGPLPSKIGKTGLIGKSPFGQLIQWVEFNVAPDSLALDGVPPEKQDAIGRVCLWPQVPIWKNDGQTLECRTEGLLAHIASRLPRLTELPVKYMEILPRLLFLRTKEEL